MSMFDLMRRSLRGLRAAKGRTILTAAAIAVGAFTLTLTLAASNGASSYVAGIIKNNFDPAELIVAKDETLLGGGNGAAKPREYDDSFGASASNAGATIQVKRLTTKDIANIRKIDGVERVREGVYVNLRYLTVAGQKRYVGTIQALNPSLDLKPAAGTVPDALSPGTVLVPEAYTSTLGFKSATDAIGKDLTIAIANGRNAFGPPQVQNFKIIGVLKKPASSQPGTELYLYGNNDDVLALNDIQTEGTSNFHKYQTANVKVSGGEDPAKLNAVKQVLKDRGYQAVSVKDTQDFLNQIISVLRGIVVAFALIALVASVFGIINTMYISVLQRTREIGLMKALGMRNRDVGRIFRYEAAIIGFVGGLIGTVLALALGLSLNPLITKQLSLESGTNLLIFNPLQMLGLLAALTIVAVLAGFLPSRRAAKLDPIVALRTE